MSREVLLYLIFDIMPLCNTAFRVISDTMYGGNKMAGLIHCIWTGIQDCQLSIVLLKNNDLDSKLDIILFSRQEHETEYYKLILITCQR